MLRSADPRNESTALIPLRGGITLPAVISAPDLSIGIALIARASDDEHRSQDLRISAELHQAGLATLTVRLLNESETAQPQMLLDASLMASRLEQVVRWAAKQEILQRLPLGLMASSTAAAAALIVSSRTDLVRVVVARAGRVDIAGSALEKVRAPVLLIVASGDPDIFQLNRGAQIRMPPACQLVLIPDSDPVFSDPSSWQRLSELTVDWLRSYLLPA